MILSVAVESFYQAQARWPHVLPLILPNIGIPVVVRSRVIYVFIFAQLPSSQALTSLHYSSGAKILSFLPLIFLLQQKLNYHGKANYSSTLAEKQTKRGKQRFKTFPFSPPFHSPHNFYSIKVGGLMDSHPTWLILLLTIH